MKRWRLPLVSLLIVLPFAFWKPEFGKKALFLLGENILVVLGILPPVFILLGLFDVWIPRERVAPHMGEDSGVKGTVLSVLLGACSAGPLYIAFPIAEVMIRKGTSLRNIFVFIGAWSTMRIPMILFEIQNLGAVFGLTRYFVSLVGILLMALLMDRVLNTAEKTEIIARFQEE
ncbi:MAG: permease [Synergistetes bacterium HGW-Synergistetes-2]|nr:MAG: permease [Synergistetes bacterium HGW-Synergistetes-2]